MFWLFSKAWILLLKNYWHAFFPLSLQQFWLWILLLHSGPFFLILSQKKPQRGGSQTTFTRRCRLGYQGRVKTTVSGVVEDLKFKIETANCAESGKHQFWSEPSEILNLRSSTTPETVAFTLPWCKKFSKNPESANVGSRSKMSML